MIVTFPHVCPTPRCQALNDVYVEEPGPSPPADGFFLTVTDYGAAGGCKQASR
jgi:hypothetical protein